MPRKPDDDIGGPPPSKRSDYAPGGSGGRSMFRHQEPFVSPPSYVPMHEDKHECRHCFHKFKTAAALEGHILAYHNKEPERFTPLTNILTEITVMSPGDAGWTAQHAADFLRCFKCGSGSSSRAALEDHITRDHGLTLIAAIAAAGGRTIDWNHNKTHQEESPVTTPSTVPFPVDVQPDEEVAVVEEREVQFNTRSGWRMVAMIPRKVLTTGPQKYDAQGRQIPEYQDSFVYLIAKKRSTQPEESKTMATDVPKTPDKTMDMLKRNFTGAAKIGGATAVNKILVKRAREALNKIFEGKVPEFFSTPAGENFLCIATPAILHYAATNFLPAGGKADKLIAIADYAHQGASNEAVGSLLANMMKVVDGFLSEASEIVDIKELTSPDEKDKVPEEKGVHKRKTVPVES